MVADLGAAQAVRASSNRQRGAPGLPDSPRRFPTDFPGANMARFSGRADEFVATEKEGELSAIGVNQRPEHRAHGARNIVATALRQLAAVKT